MKMIVRKTEKVDRHRKEGKVMLVSKCWSRKRLRGEKERVCVCVRERDRERNRERKERDLD